MTPSPAPSSNKTASSDMGRNLQGEFIMASVNMGWQLAVVFLVPIVGGTLLDSHFKTSPIFTIIGFMVAIAATVLVIRRQIQLNSPKLDSKETKR